MLSYRAILPQPCVKECRLKTLKHARITLAVNDAEPFACISLMSALSMYFRPHVSQETLTCQDALQTHCVIESSVLTQLSALDDIPIDNGFTRRIKHSVTA